MMLKGNKKNCIPKKYFIHTPNILYSYFFVHTIFIYGLIIIEVASKILEKLSLYN